MGTLSKIVTRLASPPLNRGAVSRVTISYSTIVPTPTAGSGARTTRRSEKMFWSYSFAGESAIVFPSSQWTVPSAHRAQGSALPLPGSLSDRPQTGRPTAQPHGHTQLLTAFLSGPEFGARL